MVKKKKTTGSTGEMELIVPHPRNDKQLFGFEEVASSFYQDIKAGRQAHAYIISGSYGVGKASFAYKIAKAMLNPSKDLSSAESFLQNVDALTIQKIANQNHPDLLAIFQQEGKSSITVEQVREVNNFLHLTAFGNHYRIVIIDSIDAMNISGNNAILKILEEPPQQVIFLLICHKPGNILPTIRSRCRIININKPNIDTFTKALRQLFPHLSAGELQDLWGVSGESIGIAALMFTNNGLTLFQEMRHLLQAPTPHLQNLVSFSQRIDKDKNWAIFYHCIIVMMHKIIKEKALQKSGDLDKSLEIVNNVYSIANAVETSHLDASAAAFDIMYKLAHI